MFYCHFRVFIHAFWDSRVFIYAFWDWSHFGFAIDVQVIKFAMTGSQFKYDYSSRDSSCDCCHCDWRAPVSRLTRGQLVWVGACTGNEFVLNIILKITVPTSNKEAYKRNYGQCTLI